MVDRVASLTITVDASVWVASVSPREVAHEDAKLAIDRIMVSAASLHQPTLTLVELAAALVRRTGDPNLAREATVRLLGTPTVTFYSLTDEAAGAAMEVALASRVRGADAIYLATAASHDTVLITLDENVVARAPAGIMVMTPAQWLARPAAPGGALP